MIALFALVLGKTPLKKYLKLIVPVLFVGLLGFLALGMIYSEKQPDKQCLIPHEVSSAPPATQKTAQDYFELGNFNYDKGDCTQAIVAYTKAIELNPKYAEAYNNRAYTYMRQRDYQNALLDLDKAIEIRPNYVHALMNRGDIYNYYYQEDHQKAMADYDKVRALGPAAYTGTSLCGHRLLAQNGGWSPGVYFQLIKNGLTMAGCD